MGGRKQRRAARKRQEFIEFFSLYQTSENVRLRGGTTGLAVPGIRFGFDTNSPSEVKIEYTE
jgi:hypothetical protein